VKRLIVGGFPCSATAWEAIFPPCHEQQIIPFSDIFSSYDSSFTSLIKCCHKIIQDFEPTSIILHDISVILGLLSLIRLQKQDYPITPKIILFNGAFRGFNVFKAPHPFKIQFISFEKMSSIVSSQGGEIDPYFHSQYKKIRKLYRQIIFGSIIAMLQEILSPKVKKQIDLKNKILILASNNDAYIPYGCLERIRDEFAHTKIEPVNYGHFPYSSLDRSSIYRRVIDFENTP